MLLPSDAALHTRAHGGIQRRQSGPGSQAAIIVVVSIAIVLTMVVLSYITARSIRKRSSSTKWIPTQVLKRRWEAWDPAGKRGLEEFTSAQTGQRNSSVPTLLGQDGRRSNRASQLDLAEMNGAQSDVERHTGVRSVMTLPAYSSSARENERILGREGERDGIDVLIEAPETEEMEEARREEEMASLYQIRVQRRTEVDERNERRRERNEARERGDFVTLQRLRQESRLRAEQGRQASEANAMIMEHQSRARERRVSSVSYADLGVARHDGSRVRASSQESHRGLLSDAASIGGRPRSGSGMRDSLSVHHRDMSGSILSISDDGSDLEEVLPPFGRAGSDFEVVNLHQTHSHSRSLSRNLTPVGTRSRASSGASNGPPQIITEPPNYDATAASGEGFEEAPPYASPVRERPSGLHERSISANGAPLLPGIERLPSIRIGLESSEESGAR